LPGKVKRQPVTLIQGFNKSAVSGIASRIDDPGNQNLGAYGQFINGFNINW